jgi:hypothetical protein
METRRTVTREVRAEDPGLSPEANRLLTEELRRGVGRDRVEVPEGAPARSRRRHARHGPVVTALAANVTVLLFTFLALIVVGVIVSLATGSWWALLIALGVDLVGTLVAAGSAIGLAREVEHVQPGTAARLEAEGVADPDRLFTELVADFAGATRTRRASEERTADAGREPAQATAEQRPAMTPTAHPSKPRPDRRPFGSR